jgi:ubiquinone/menaquinone biosynthesis C-methylase UbiE
MLVNLRDIDGEGVATRADPAAPDPYRRIAGWYDRIFGRLNAGLRGIGLKMFPPRAGMKILDVGCGTGIQLALYQDTGCQVSGIDSSPAMLAAARRRLGEQACLHLGDASRMPYADGAFDLIIAATVLHEMLPETRDVVLREMRRTLLANGRIMLIDFEHGPVRPLRGWVTKAIITVSEVAAGHQHFRNYCHFIAHGALPALIDAHGLLVDQRKIVSRGAIGLYLVSIG